LEILWFLFLKNPLRKWSMANDPNPNNHLLYLQPKPLPQRRRRGNQQQAATSTNNVTENLTTATTSNNCVIHLNTIFPDQYHRITDTAQYEFLDHTADVLLHSQGEDIKSALANAILGMMAYQIGHPDSVELTHAVEISATGHDLISLSYNILDAALYRLVGDNFIAGGICIHSYIDATSSSEKTSEGINNLSSFSITATLYGEFYEPLGKHGQGTEVKAITFSGLQVIPSIPNSTGFDAYIVLDI
jgi:SHS2 domain-containing protein